ncbi:MAG: hypothetical protein OXI41_10770 [Chloroflexota bacterium]|nr:hypothetical protein [Chloroflexota bacterium]MDE2894006.1 hypothetical protein [Chloroflexota bacterium]
MNDHDDPLIDHVIAEAERIERAVDRRYERRGGLTRLSLPAIDNEDANREQTFTWRYLFTWQEAERSRRYVIALPVDRCIVARQPVEEQIEKWLVGRSAAASVAGPRVKFREGLRAYEVTTRVTLSGTEV